MSEEIIRVPWVPTVGCSCWRCAAAREAVAPPLPLSLNGSVQLAARELPDGFQIHVHVERGAGWVSLDYPGAPFDYRPDGAGMSLSEQILECLEKAKATPVVRR
jgi:hypothetical protein